MIKKSSTYSRLGCEECKKAHVKCDENRPRCGRCQKTYKACIYSSNFVVKMFNGSFNVDMGRISSSSNNFSLQNNKDDNDKNNNNSNNGISMKAFATSKFQANLNNKIKVPNVRNKNLKTKTMSTVTPREKSQIKSHGKLQFSFKPGIRPKIDAHKKYLRKFNLNVNENIPKSLHHSPKLKASPHNNSNYGSTVKRIISVYGASQTLCTQENSSVTTYISSDSFDEKIEKKFMKYSSSSMGISSINSNLKSLKSDILDPIETPTLTDNNQTSDVNKIDRNIFFRENDVKLMKLLNYEADFIPNDPDIIDEEIIRKTFNLIKSHGLEGLIKNDPLPSIFLNTKEDNSTVVQLTKQNSLEIVKFCWEVMIAELTTGLLQLLPFEYFKQVILNMKQITVEFPEFNEAIIYLASHTLKTYYNIQKKFSLADLWDRYYRIPSLQKSLQTVHSLIDNYQLGNNSFYLLVYARISLDTYSWKKSQGWEQLTQQIIACLKQFLDQHLKGNFKFEESKPEFNSILSIHFCWIMYMQQCAYFLSSEVSIFGSVEDIDYFIKYTTSTHLNKGILMGNNFNLISGNTLDINSLFGKLWKASLQLKNEGIILTGIHIIKLKLTNKDERIRSRLHRLGAELKDDLALIVKNTDMYPLLQSDKYNGLENSLENSQKIAEFAMSLYIDYYLIGNYSNHHELSVALKKLLEFWYSIPSNHTSSISYWTIYIGANISLTAGEYKLFNKYISLLESQLTASKLYIISQSITQLKRFQECVENKDFDGLIKPVHKVSTSS
ncbi:hypothetical protein TBLA_0E03050 [Henningerozyma blattae CBS 6284]|uniref:Zn(2)-C6 fungal-type domain-containing protein n=1 Tax=Henningerozyma blattae (strain ATCC 34711 / CBS 6284 / DSM 70876 / NBRC 10599 / NRRL Y-10934 / UCD 77-7) TaxID=1071380 RepID=I2H4Q7_HENB6|nr:hypothetical protein TBLA_0E03050 [Tetrapisispora blattae CBS 6284]CCH61359.1 hypothetical protein TBLA_0E03050 [Tetrapisispora blattae CBS 6284]